MASPRLRSAQGGRATVRETATLAAKNRRADRLAKFRSAGAVASPRRAQRVYLTRKRATPRVSEGT